MKRRKEWIPVCLDCKEEKPLNEFSIKKNRHNTNTIYRNGVCKKCMAIRMKKWKEKNIEKYNEYQKNYQREYYSKQKKAL